MGVILLILLLLLGAGGFFAFRYVTSRGGNTANTSVKSEITPTQSALTTTPINATVTYASVTLTILNARLPRRADLTADLRFSRIVRWYFHGKRAVYPHSGMVSIFPTSQDPSFASAPDHTLREPED